MILVDSTIWDAAKRKRDKSHAVAVEVLGELMEGKFGRVVVTDYIIDEVLTWLSAHTTHEIAVETSDLFFNSGEIEIEKIDWAVLREARELFRKYDFLSFTDATTVVIATIKGIKDIATLDEDFCRLGFNVVPSGRFK
jgi:predicted nucleic acid-binding protein